MSKGCTEMTNIMLWNNSPSHGDVFIKYIVTNDWPSEASFHLFQSCLSDENDVLVKKKRMSHNILLLILLLSNMIVSVV